MTVSYYYRAKIKQFVSALQTFEQVPNCPRLQNGEVHFPYSSGPPRGYCSFSDKWKENWWSPNSSDHIVKISAIKSNWPLFSDPAKIEARVQKVGGPLYEWSKEEKSKIERRKKNPKDSLGRAACSSAAAAAGFFLSFTLPEPTIRSVFTALSWLIPLPGNVTLKMWT